MIKMISFSINCGLTKLSFGWKLNWKLLYSLHLSILSIFPQSKMHYKVTFLSGYSYITKILIVCIYIIYIYIHTQWCFVVINEGLYFDLAQGQMNGAPNETRTHSCRFASLDLLTITPPEVPHTQWCFGCDTWLHLVVRLQLWRSGKCDVTSSFVTPGSSLIGGGVVLVSVK